MTEHTTHFEDCGCHTRDLQKTCAQLNDVLTAAEREIAGLEAEVEKLRHYHKAWGELAEAVGPLKAEVDRLREAAHIALDYIERDEHTHGREFRAGIALREALAGKDGEK